MSHGEPTFYLGTHLAGWLRNVDVPLFISRRRLTRYRTLPVAATDWALDSGGFTELAMFGSWATTAHEYADDVTRFSEGVGRLQWAAPQDWMCEPSMLHRTGLTIAEHQRRSVESVCQLRQMTLVPIIPVLQGWKVADYVAHVEMYEHAGIDLYAEAVVGVGSICRRQATREAAEIARQLQPLRLHAFGAKQDALRLYGHRLASCDSMAWSFGGRRKPDPSCPKGSCANCLHYAMAWRSRLLEHGEAQENRQLELAL